MTILLVAAATAGCGSTDNHHSPKASAYLRSPHAYAGEAAAEALFQQNCSSCHTLSAANASFGTLGPNLDTLKPERWMLVYQMQVGGYVMPAFGADQILTQAEIDAIAKYVVTVAG
jgi:mono/diheme cytochrome c family protein